MTLEDMANEAATIGEPPADDESDKQSDQGEQLELDFELLMNDSLGG